MPEKKPSLPTQELVDIQDIKDDVVILKNGGLRRVLLVTGINFDLKSEEEKNAILGAYQNFINSLDFSLQIVIHTRKLNIEGYLQKLKEREMIETAELLQNQIAEYAEFVRSFVEANAVMNKKFFVVVPYDPIQIPKVEGLKLSKLFKRGGTPKMGKFSLEDVAHQINQLNQRVDRVTEGLSEIGLRAVPLNTEELIELFYNVYNPEAVEKRELEIAKTPESQLGIGADDGGSLSDAVKNILAPAAMEVNSDFIRIGNKIAKTFFILTYPRYLSTGWFSPIINLPNLMDVSIFIHPVETAIALRNLRKKATQIEAQIASQQEKGMIRDPILETALQDIETLRDALQQSVERLFQIGVYFTVVGETAEEIKKIETEIASMLESRLVYSKPAIFQQLEGFSSTLPLGIDGVGVTTPMNSGPASSLFPFVSADLTSDEGILYGINRHNNTLTIFDRFSLENANMVIFAKSGAGKSYAAKLEIIRSLMSGTDIIVIDPENEYKNLADAVGGSFFKISLDSENHINPLEIPIVPPDESPGDVLKSHFLNLVGLLKIMLGKITPQEEGILDRAIRETYASRNIVPEKDFSKATPPLLGDLETVLENMEGGRSISEQLYRFTKGSYAGFTNRPTNIDIKNRLIVFSIRDLEEELRPIAMYIILNFIWNLIRAEFKKRLVMIDEAWWMMKYPDGASFLFGLAKRARKYYLGITTITQDVEDFILSQYGRPIITNSSLQLLLKQSPAMIDIVTKTFDLTDAEKNLLLEANIGEGLFFAGLKHAYIYIVASPFEDKIVTTKPEQLLEMERFKEKG
ncbi:MAG: ATP-binding protein [Parcubacteria group bacterium]|nr:ATP-binding protein [Parcubacteria group bacterium]